MGNIATTIAAAIATAATAAAPVFAPEAPPRPQSVIEFDASQRGLFEDKSRVIAVNWHRQKGKDFTAAHKAVDDALETGNSWFIVALTQAQADETFAKCQKAVEAIKLLLKMMGRPMEDRLALLEGAVIEEEEFVDRDKEIDQAFTCKARIIRLPSGARIVSLPGKDPDTLAGRSGNLILTEFGLYPKGGYEHWDVLFPIVTKSRYQLILISTPRGRNTKFYEVCQNPDGFYSVHFCDIRKSVFEEGYVLYGPDNAPLPAATDDEKEAAIETFRKIYNSPTKWPREYLCEFTGDLSALVTWAELQNASSLDNPDGFRFVRFDDQTAVTPAARDWLGKIAGSLRGRRVEVGWDVARTADLSIVTVNVTPSIGPKRLVAVCAMRNCSYEFMRTVVSMPMSASFLAVGAGDATGLGNESNETLRLKYGERWTAFMFSASGKRELASNLKTAFSDGTQTLPPIDGEHKFLHTDIYAVQRDDTGANETYEEGKNELMPESHCDFAWSLGLARQAGVTHAKLPMRPPQRQKPRGW